MQLATGIDLQILVFFTMTSLGIIVPVLNESDAIVSALDRLRSQHGWDECIVVDGGSHDGTVRQAHTHPLHVQVIEQAGGIASQLNTGLAASTCDSVLIVGADCRLSGHALTTVRKVVANGALTGCLRMYNSIRSSFFRWQDCWAHLRVSWTNGAYLDQAPFYQRRAALHFGFRERGTYTTADLCQRLAVHQRFSRVDAAVVASCRHWQRQGLIGGTLAHQRLRLRHWWNYAL